MKLSNNPIQSKLYAETIQLHYKENRTFEDAKREHEIRKDNPELDRMLYEADKAEVFFDMPQARNLLLKLAQNEEMTEEERKYLEENYPDYVMQADLLKKPEGQATDKLDSKEINRMGNTMAEELRKKFQPNVDQFRYLDEMK